MTPKMGPFWGLQMARSHIGTRYMRISLTSGVCVDVRQNVPQNGGHFGAPTDGTLDPDPGSLKWDEMGSGFGVKTAREQVGSWGSTHLYMCDT